MRVPDLEAEPAEVEPVPEEPAASPEADANWWLKTEDGEQYGPISRSELDAWYQEGRVTADSQLLLDGGDQWVWASDVYPDLEASSSEPNPPAPAPPAPSVTPPAGPVVGPTAGSRTGAAPGAFDFAAGDMSATARARGRKRVKKKVAQKRPPSVAAAAPTATAAAPVTPPATGELSDKSKVVAGLLGLFLGPYGVHRFYLGYTGLGLCMLFTCGGCGIWSLIDTILVFVGSVPDAEGRPLQ